MGMERNQFDDLILRRLNGERPDLSEIDAAELLGFACREAYYHIRGRAPNITEDDPSLDKARCAAFVCEALEAALERASCEVA